MLDLEFEGADDASLEKYTKKVADLCIKWNDRFGHFLYGCVGVILPSPSLLFSLSLSLSLSLSPQFFFHLYL